MTENPAEMDWLDRLRVRIAAEAIGSPGNGTAAADAQLLDINHGPCSAPATGACLCGQPWPCDWTRTTARRYGIEPNAREEPKSAKPPLGCSDSDAFRPLGPG